MKHIINFFIVVLLTVSSLYSQNEIDPNSIGTYTDTIVNFNNSDLFIKNAIDYTLGWNYGLAGRQLDQLMNANFILQGWNWDHAIDFSNYGDNIGWYLTVNPLNQASFNGNDRGVGGTQSIYYEPGIGVVSDDSFTPTSNDTQGAVFGFQQGTSKKMNEALGNTVYAGGWYPDTLNNSSNPLDMIIQVEQVFICTKIQKL